MAIGISPRSPSNEQFPGAANQEVTAVTATAVSASLIAARPTRAQGLVQNTSKNETVYIGPTDPATAANGVPVEGGESYTFTYVGELFVISEGGSADLVVTDEYN